MEGDPHNEVYDYIGSVPILKYSTRNSIEIINVINLSKIAIFYTTQYLLIRNILDRVIGTNIYSILLLQLL